MAVPTDPVPLPARTSAADIDAIASRTFSSSFRGWDPDEVRVHLVQVAETVRAMAQRQTELERRLVEAEATARRADIAELDVDEVATILGEETARVLRTARESATEIMAKAEERVSLLTRQAADDAAATRESATVDAEGLRKAAHEQAAASRAAGEAYVEELRAEAETELAAARAAVDEELGALRQAARDDAAQVGAQADDAAAQIRADADADAASARAAAEEDAAATRADADAYAATVRGEADEVLSSRTAEAERAAVEVRDVALREAEALRVAAQTEHDRSMAESTERVAEAERVRERVLADLARKRKSARQHLEQLRAGRDRLLEAYDVVRATTENATRELGTVLPDAKRAANDAARRVASEPDQTVEDLEAELAMARDANLPIMAPAEVPEAETAANGDDDDDGEVIVDLGSLDESDDAADVDTPVIDLGSGPPDATGSSAGTAMPDGPDSTPDAASSVSDATSTSDELSEPSRDASNESPPAAASSADAGVKLPPRKAGRRHRHDDPLDGEELPEVPLAPVEAGEDFEAVRVIDTGEVEVVDEATEPEVAIAAPTAELAAGAGSGVRVIRHVQPVPKPASGAEAALAAVARGVSPTPGVDEPDKDEPDKSTAPQQSKVSSEKASEEQPSDKKPSDAKTTPAPPTAADATPTKKSATASSETESDTKSDDTSPTTSSATGEAAKEGGDASAPGGQSTDIDGLFERLRRERGETSTDDAPSTDKDASDAADQPTSAKADTAESTKAKKPAKAAKKSADTAATKPAAAPGGAGVDVAAAKSGNGAKNDPAQVGADTSDDADSAAGADADGAPNTDEDAGANAPDARLADLFERRDAAVDEVSRRLAKRLKRVLSDEQSELLDVLRRSKKQPATAELLPAPDVHEAGFVAAAEADLPAAAIAGVRFAGDIDDSALESVTVPIDDIAGSLARSITGPLRTRLERALGDTAGDDEDSAVVDELELADRIRSCYREWRGNRLGDLANDACATALSEGLRAALPDDVGLQWHVDRADKPCADCDDNVLAGVVAKGEPFPTGQLTPPAHPGCRCLALPPMP